VNDLFNSRKATNITANKAYTDPVSKAVSQPYDQYYYQPGRSITGDITLSF
jgi:iron complex outermembrane recepter protein